MSRDKRTIKILDLNEMKAKLCNDELAEFLMDYKENNRLTSKPEITFICHIMAFFKPLTFTKVVGSINSIVGVFQGLDVKFDLQYKVLNSKTKRSFSIDLVLKLIDKENDLTYAEIGLEYDGADRHITQYGVIGDKEKDLTVLKEVGFHIIRIDPTMFNNNEKIRDSYKAIKRFFERNIKNINQAKNGKLNDKVTLLKESNSRPSLAVKTKVPCRVCEGVDFLGDDYCPLCKGEGRVLSYVSKTIDLANYNDFKCPECQRFTKSSPLKNCKICQGMGRVDRETAVNFSRKESTN